MPFGLYVRLKMADELIGAPPHRTHDVAGPGGSSRGKHVTQRRTTRPAREFAPLKRC
jgi:hypothetical protein